MPTSTSARPVRAVAQFCPQTCANTTLKPQHGRYSSFFCGQGRARAVRYCFQNECLSSMRIRPSSAGYVAWIRSNEPCFALLNSYHMLNSYFVSHRPDTLPPPHARSEQRTPRSSTLRWKCSRDSRRSWRVTCRSSLYRSPSGTYVRYARVCRKNNTHTIQLILSRFFPRPASVDGRSEELGIAAA